MKNIIKLIKNILEMIQTLINKLLTLLDNNVLTMSAAVYDSTGRYLLYFAKNDKLLETKEIVKAIFDKLQSDVDFKKFGSKKIIFMQCFIDGNKYAFHPNVLITNTMSFEDYWMKIEDEIINHYENSVYWVNIIPTFEIKIWNLDEIANKNIKGNTDTPTKKGFQSVKSLAKSIHTLSLSGFQSRSDCFPGFLGFQRLAKNSHPFGWRTGSLIRCKHTNTIKPFKDRKFYDVKPLEGFSSMDIETITLKTFDNIQIPIVITSYSSYNLPSSDKIFIQIVQKNLISISPSLFLLFI